VTSNSTEVGITMYIIQSKKMYPLNSHYAPHWFKCNCSRCATMDKIIAAKLFNWWCNDNTP
jgi:hypothetical protein